VKLVKLSPVFGTTFRLLCSTEIDCKELAQSAPLLRRPVLSAPACRVLVWTGRPSPQAAQSVLQTFQVAPLRQIFLLRAPRWERHCNFPRLPGFGSPHILCQGQSEQRLIRWTKQLGDYPWWCRFQKCGGSPRGFAPDGGRGGEDKGSRGETTFLAVLNCAPGTGPAQVLQLSP